MKIALHYFGHLRTFRECLPTHKQHLITPDHQFDIYMHTWDHSDRRTKSWYEISTPIDDIDNDVVSFIEKLLNIKKLKVEAQTVTARDRADPFISSRKMHESLRKSIRLRRDPMFGHKPDLVVAIRPDIYLKAPLDLAAIERASRDQLLRRAIFTPTHNHPPCGLFQTDRLAARDSIIVGSSVAMSEFRNIGLDNNIYHKFEKYNQIGEIFLDNFTFSQRLRWIPIEYIAPDAWEIRRA